MRTNYILTTILAIALVAVVLGLASAGLMDVWNSNQRIASPERQEAAGERSAVQSDTGETLTAAVPQSGLQFAASEVDEQLAARPQAQAGNAEANPATPPAAASPETPPPDGAALVQERCSPCHLSAQLEQVKKPAAEWDLILARMEGLGVRLSELDKAALRDYLAVARQP